MPEQYAYTDGTPSWVDVSTPDIEAAKKFYGGLFGWEFTGGDAEFMGYTNAELHGRKVAGIGPHQPDIGGQPAWGTYLHTTNVDAIMEKARSANGVVVVEPMTVGSFGRMALALDPTGALVGFWEPNEHRGAELVNESGALFWNALLTTDLEASKAFYAQLFDYQYRPIDNNVPDQPVFELAGHPVASAEITTGSAFWLPYFGVPNADTAVSKVQELGGTVRSTPKDQLYGREAVCADPWGAVFAVFEPGSE